MLQLIGLLCSGQDKIDKLLKVISVFGFYTDVQKTPLGPSVTKHDHYTVTQRCVYLLSSLGQFSICYHLWIFNIFTINNLVS